MDSATRRAAAPGRHPDRGTIATALVLAALTAAAWYALLPPSFVGDAAMSRMAEPGMAQGTGMAGRMADQTGAGFLLNGLTFVTAWLVMMAAMMLPSAAPMVMVYRRIARGSAAASALDTSVFVSAYLVAWALFGVAVYLVQRTVADVAAHSPGVDAAWPYVVAAVLAVAGLYQSSGLKYTCLRQCRSPWSFVLERWRAGAPGAFELGLRHGLYCIGCCWGLMAVLVVAGAMGLAWVTLIAAVIFAEKLLPPGRAAARVVGVVLLALAAAVIAVPDIAYRLAA